MFNESDDEEMTDLLKVTASPPSTAVERSFEAEKARVGSLDRIDGIRGASPVTETTAVVDAAPKMPMGPPTTELLPESGL